ncbi:GNAT family N-acetyltransferase [Vibrio sp. SCSIO 43136]|uniref:GNAT family N-acetyltransferase n=1 Tax=Vibrio sp. SCSIO 43136 TaxID=2819101 RepID=UPI002074F512|nr:GNAT family N-acetyltransferase [Vibrio sp. SCSIO 43136]USD66418.1 GNAT family N-acetyltransferase [Vibrio sp. SCSIO 43136]
MNIRKASKQDSHQLLELIRLKADFDRSMKGFDGQVSTTVDKIERTLFGEQPYAHALLLELNGDALGFALFHYRYSSFSGEPSIWLDDLLVLGDHRSKGYGAELMEALKTEARKSSASHISWTASPYNIMAHDFYRRLGADIERMDGQRPYFRWKVLG